MLHIQIITNKRTQARLAIGMVKEHAIGSSRDIQNTLTLVIGWYNTYQQLARLF